LISYLLSSSELSQLFRFLSPNWLQVTSPVDILKLVRQLQKNHSSTSQWQETQNSCRRTLESLGLSVAGKIPGRSRSQAALTLFFSQILFREVWILDFRTSSFEGIENAWSWNPKSYYFEMSSAFVQGIRNLYRGFYRNDDALFEEALASLQLSAARESLRKHFGTGDQSNVRFQLKTFQSTFADVFESCARNKIKLHPDFFILGFMLLGLYENLEQSGETLDVRSIFQELDRL
jgi:hypothetical protein